MDDVMRKAFQRWFNSRSIRHFDTAFEAGWNAALRGLERGKEPVAWRFYADGQWFTGSTREACHKMLTNAGINAEIHPLYASAPPAVGGTVQVPRLVATAPKLIYLGVFDDAGVEQQDFPEDHEGITWCTDNVGHADVEYIRADLAAAPGAK